MMQRTLEALRNAIGVRGTGTREYEKKMRSLDKPPRVARDLPRQRVRTDSHDSTKHVYSMRGYRYSYESKATCTENKGEEEAVPSLGSILYSAGHQEF